MIVRIPPDTCQMAIAKPIVTHQSCFCVSTSLAVLLSTWNAACDMCGLMFLAASAHALSRFRNPSRPNANNRNGTTAVTSWNESALAHVIRLRSLNDRTSSRTAPGNSARADALVAVAMPQTYPLRGQAMSACAQRDPESARHRCDRGGDGRLSTSRLAGVLASKRCRSDCAPADVAERLRRQWPRTPPGEWEGRPLVLDSQRQGGEDLAAQPARPDAVARVTDAEVQPTATPEEREAVGRHVDRAAPCALDLDVGECRKQPPEPGLRTPLRSGVGEEAIVDDTAEPDLPCARAHQHPAVVGGSEIVQEGTPVGECLVTRPPDRLEPIRRGLGQHDPAAHVGDAVGYRAPAGHPRVRGHDVRIRADAAGGGADPRGARAGAYTCAARAGCPTGGWGPRLDAGDR